MSPIEFAISLGITVIMAMPPECQDTEEHFWRGCFKTDTPNWVYVDPRIKDNKRYQIFVMMHEIGHQQHNKIYDRQSGEKYADDYAGVMMKRYKW